jgi:hypothetical protein
MRSGDLISAIDNSTTFSASYRREAPVGGMVSPKEMIRLMFTDF